MPTVGCPTPTVVEREGALPIYWGRWTMPGFTEAVDVEASRESWG
ncbi:hypothetical protein [Streptosporangium sp. NPDC087985]